MNSGQEDADWEKIDLVPSTPEKSSPIAGLVVGVDNSNSPEDQRELVAGYELALTDLKSKNEQLARELIIMKTQVEEAQVWKECRGVLETVRAVIVSGQTEEGKKDIDAPILELPRAVRALIHENSQLKTSLHEAELKYQLLTTHKETAKTPELEEERHSVLNMHSSMVFVTSEKEAGEECKGCRLLKVESSQLRQQLAAMESENQGQSIPYYLSEELRGIERALESVLEKVDSSSALNEALQSLSMMGFSKAKAQAALQSTNNNLVEALNLLTNEQSSSGLAETNEDVARGIIDSIKRKIRMLHSGRSSAAIADESVRRLEGNCFNSGNETIRIKISNLQPGDVTLFLADGTGEFYALAVDNCRYKLSEETKVLIGQNEIDASFFNDKVVLGTVVYVSNEKRSDKRNGSCEFQVSVAPFSNT